MMNYFSFNVEIAGITIRFEAPRAMEIPPELKPFLTDKIPAQEIYRIEFIHKPIQFDILPSYTSTGLVVYSSDEATYRKFMHLKVADDCVPLCCLRSNGYLDEPTIGLDIVVKDNIRKAIRQINEQYNTTVILTTHDIGDIEELCSRIIIIDEGRKIYDGTLQHLRDSYGTHRIVRMEVHHEPKERLWETLGVSPEDCVSTYDAQRKTLEVRFDKAKLHAPQILGAVMQETDVSDVQIIETDLAQIVKQIYTHGLGEGRA